MLCSVAGTAWLLSTGQVIPPGRLGLSPTPSAECRVPDAHAVDTGQFGDGYPSIPLARLDTENVFLFHYLTLGNGVPPAFVVQRFRLCPRMKKILRCRECVRNSDLRTGTALGCKLLVQHQLWNVAWLTERIAQRRELHIAVVSAGECLPGGRQNFRADRLSQLPLQKCPANVDPVRRIQSGQLTSRPVQSVCA